MSRRYDSRTTMFSPEGNPKNTDFFLGRLYQVEYAIEAISHAGTVLGILTTQGIVLLAQKKTVSKLLEVEKSIEKLYVLNEQIMCGVAGITSDANILTEDARKIAYDYESTYGSNIPVELLVKRICNIKQSYTQFGGYDDDFGFQLYKSDPSGNYTNWNACCIGSSNQTAESILKEEYKTNMSLEEAYKLAIKIFEMGVLRLHTDESNESQNTIVYEIFNMDKIDSIIKKFQDEIKNTEKISD